MPPEDPKSRTARTVRAVGHKASGGHSLLTPRTVGHRLHREPNDFSDHHRGRSRMVYVPYPRWLHFEDGPSILVQDEAEEVATLAAHAAAATVEPVAEEPAPKRGPGRPVKAKAEPPEKVFDLSPGDDSDPPKAA